MYEVGWFCWSIVGSIYGCVLYGWRLIVEILLFNMLN